MSSFVILLEYKVQILQFQIIPDDSFSFATYPPNSHSVNYLNAVFSVPLIVLYLLFQCLL